MLRSLINSLVEKNSAEQDADMDPVLRAKLERRKKTQRPDSRLLRFPLSVCSSLKELCEL
jgi:hypothetical protein